MLAAQPAVQPVKHEISNEGIRDQYADGKAAKVWETYIGDKNVRTKQYRNFLVNLLHKNGCRRILDVACGTGIDSILLLEEGFDVVSIDASDKMLKYALKERWNRRKESKFDNWIIEEANWLSLHTDIQHLVGHGFDAVMCLGNSFAHMLDAFGDQREQRLAIENFEKCVKPGGILLIDHRNYDKIMDTGSTPSKCLYYNSNQLTDITTSVLYVGGKPATVILDYRIRTKTSDDQFQLSYYPHKFEVFSQILQSVFGKNSSHYVFGDFASLDTNKKPDFYIHIMQKNFN